MQQHKFTLQFQHQQWVGAQNDPLTTAAEMQAAVQALGNKTVYISVGAANQATPPVTAVANLGTVAIVEVPFKLA